MKTIRLADLLVLKYKLAIAPAELEAGLRKKLAGLAAYPNKLFNILKACADSGASKPKTPNERVAVAGHLFCKELLGWIDYLSDNASTLSLGEIREGLLNIGKLIERNKNATFNKAGKYDARVESEGKQFPHVSELIFQMTPIKRKHEIKLRDEQYSKARTGLARIVSITSDMIDDIRKLEVMVPEKFTHKDTTDVDINAKMPGRFKPQRAPISINDIVDFINQHGADYGISSREDWATVFRDDPELKDKMTTVINTINRTPKDETGRPVWAPKDAAEMKMIIAEVLKEVEASKSTNAHLFE